MSRVCLLCMSRLIYVIDILTVPTRLEITLTSSTETTISISWTIAAGSVVDSYQVLWERDTSVGCPDQDENSASVSGASTSYNITGLEEDSSYSVTLLASNRAGSINVSVVRTTEEESEWLKKILL